MPTLLPAGDPTAAYSTLSTMPQAFASSADMKWSRSVSFSVLLALPSS